MGAHMARSEPSSSRKHFTQHHGISITTNKFERVTPRAPKAGSSLIKTSSSFRLETFLAFKHTPKTPLLTPFPLHNKTRVFNFFTSPQIQWTSPRCNLSLKSVIIWADSLAQTRTSSSNRFVYARFLRTCTSK